MVLCIKPENDKVGLYKHLMQNNCDSSLEIYHHDTFSEWHTYFITPCFLDVKKSKQCHAVKICKINMPLYRNIFKDYVMSVNIKSIVHFIEIRC